MLLVQPPVRIAASFAEIVGEHQAMVYSIGWHFLRDRAGAEEVAQDVFLQLYRNLDTIESPSHLTNWLRTVMTRACIDRQRRARLRPRLGLADIREPAAAEHPVDPILAGRLEELVAQLPERSRMIVILRFQEDLDPAEIAEILEIPVGTVKSNLHRSLALLRGKLERARRRSMGAVR